MLDGRGRRAIVVVRSRCDNAGPPLRQRHKPVALKVKVRPVFSASIMALARPQYTPAPLRTARPFTLNPAHHLCW